jgi:hypothetical protein
MYATSILGETRIIFFYSCCRSNYLFWRKGVSLEVSDNERIQIQNNLIYLKQSFAKQLTLVLSGVFFVADFFPATAYI